MKDQDILLNTLISLKHLKAFFATFQQEANEESVRTCVDSAYEEIMRLQREVYDMMIDKSFMKVSYQTQSAVDKEYKKYENKTCE